MKFFPAILLALLISGCESTYYNAMEKVGYHKREILVDRVADAQSSQQEAQQQFSSALEELQVLTQFDGGDLEEVYDQVSSQYKKSVSSAEEVSSRIDKVASVADALFEEWQQELSEYQSDSLRKQSELRLKDTQVQYQQMLTTMRRAESSMEPVLRRLKDNELYLKHNLNAQAVGAIGSEFTQLEGEIEALISEMQAAIDESKRFISTLN